MLFRYILLVGAAGAALWGAINLGASDTNMLLVNAAGGIPAADTSLWILGAVAAFIALSLGRFVAFGLPSMAGGWYRGNKSWLYFSGAGAAIYAMMYLV